MNNKMDFERLAEDALRINRNPETWNSGTYHDNNFKQVMVPRIIAALAQAYGEGLAEGRMQAQDKR